MTTSKLSALTLAFATAAIAGCSSSNGPSTDGGYSFRSDAPDRYVRVDRTGQPAIATALLSRDPAIVPIGPTGAAIEIPIRRPRRNKDKFSVM